VSDPEETPGRRGRAANIFDVARLAGVSHQTVSRVINDMPNVRPATRARVERAIAQLHYSPSPAARALVTRRTRTIGLVTPGISDYGPTSIAMHFNFAARAARYSVETVSAPPDDPKAIRAVIDALLRQRVDAIVLVVVDVAVLELVRSLDLTVPVVVVARDVASRMDDCGHGSSFSLTMLTCGRPRRRPAARSARSRSTSGSWCRSRPLRSRCR